MLAEVLADLFGIHCARCFCLPVSLLVWRSGILRQGGFRDYSLYLLWAQVSVIYSLLPSVSIERVLAILLPFLPICAIAISIRCEDDARCAMGVLFACCGILVLVDLIALIAIPVTSPGVQTQKAECCVTADGLHPNFPLIISRVGQ
jgi:hypothetical protein